MKTTKMLEDLISIAQQAEVDLRKFDNGNIAAGIRARKVMQKIRSKAYEIRKQIQKIRKQIYRQRKG